jgi:hypothetical protein
MSDWKSRATSVQASTNDWKSRSAPVDASGNGEGSPGVAAMGTDQAQAPEEPLSRKISNTLAGFGQGATAGYMPQITGGIQAAGNMLMGNEPNYVGERDAEIARLKKASDENPYLYKGAQAGGAVGSALMLPGAATGASRLARVLYGAGGGAAIGAAQNPGDKPGVIDPVQGEERAKNAGLGALIGGGSGATLEALSKYGPDMLNKVAETSAFKALGPYARDVKRAMARDSVRDIGRTALDEGVVGGTPTSFSGIADRATAAKTARGEEVGQILGELGSQEAAPTISRQELGKELRNELIQPAHADVASVAAKNQALDKSIGHFETGPNPEQPLSDTIPLLEAEMKKRALDQNINWRRLPQDDIPVGEQADIALRGKLAKSVEDKAAQVNPEKANQYIEAKNAYGNLDKAESLAKGKTAHEMAKQLIAPSLGGAVGFAQGHTLEERLQNALVGAAGGYAMRGAQLYGPQIVAPLANNLAKIAPLASKVNPWIAPAIATQGGQ